MATAIILVFAGGGWGGAEAVARSSGDAHLNGSVYVCSAIVEQCTRVAETVTLLIVHGTTLGDAVATQYATHGRFSFVVAPGKYFPVARVADSRCIAGQAVVRAHEEVRDNVLCVKRARRGT